MGRNIIIIITIMLFLLNGILVFGNEVQDNLSPFSGKRAILDGDIPIWTNKEDIDRILRRIKRAGFNVYMPTVWQGRGTAWPSKYAPWDTKLADRSKINFDPLRYLIQKAHKMEIEVHPWFTLSLRQDNFLPEFRLPGKSSNAFDVHNQKFREFIRSLVEEVVTNYDVDGINLDYVRAVDLCLSDICQEEYKQKYNRDLSTDASLFNLIPIAAPSLIEYQEAAVTSMVKTISESIRAKKPQILISADVFVGHAPLSQGQATAKWVNERVVDVVFRMDYSRRINVASMEATRHELNNANRQSLLISNMSNPAELGPGDKPFARDGKWLSETIGMITRRWPETGIAVYFYKYLSDEQIDSLKQ